MNIRTLLVFLTLAGVCAGSDRQDQPDLKIMHFTPAPDHRAYVACLDSDFMDFSRVIILVVPSMQKPVFYRQTNTRFTEAYWSPDSRHCVITDAPTNAGPEMWLVYNDGRTKWSTRKFKPFDRLDEQYYETQDRNAIIPVRDGYESFRWLDNHRFEFVILHKLGRYKAEIDSSSKTLKPILTKLQ